MGPFRDDQPNPEASGTFLYLNTGKRSVTLDIETEDGRAVLRELLRDADVLIEDRMPGELAGLGLGYEDLQALNPGLIVTSITPFGQVGPYRDYKARHLNLYHASGQGYLLPMWAINLDVPPARGRAIWGFTTAAWPARPPPWPRCSGATTAVPASTSTSRSSTR
ncbi:MAG: CoA transferase [Paracoccus aminovorans]|nr:CoA transferase [Paracoccus aminovorans]